MNELITTNKNENGDILVSGRELHEFLKIKTSYKRWFERMAEYGFSENVDFTVIAKNVQDESVFGGTRNITDHALTLDMAKEISMIQRTEKGKEARQYFLSIERLWNSPEMVMKRALQIADKKVKILELENESLRPKAIFADAVSTSETTILVGELAKILKQNGINIGAKRLFEWLRSESYLIKRKGSDWNMPTQKSMNLGLFEIKETVISRSNGKNSISKTAKVTGKGQQYFIDKFLKNEKLLKKVS